MAGAPVRRADELAIAAPADRTWELLLDLPRLARALPGATLDSDPVGGSYRGTLRQYAGTATLQDVDEDERVASLYLQGHEAAGPGTAAATVTCRVLDRDGTTRLLVETELTRSDAEERVAALLGDVAGRLERELGGGAPLDASAAAVAIGERVLLVLAGIAAGFAVGRLFGRRR